MDYDQRRVDIISFMAPVNDATVSRLIDIAYTAHAEGSKQIRLYISSTGGKLYPAFTAYHFFRALRIPFYTHNIGAIECPGLLLYLASDNRSASPHSQFLFYNFEWSFYRDHIRYPEIVEAYKALTVNVNCYAHLYKERTQNAVPGKELDIDRCLTGPAEVLGPEEALEAGIVTEEKIEAPGIPELAKLWSVHN